MSTGQLMRQQRVWLYGDIRDFKAAKAIRDFGRKNGDTAVANASLKDLVQALREALASEEFNKWHEAYEAKKAAEAAPPA